jgi:hypothetical protein
MNVTIQSDPKMVDLQAILRRVIEVNGASALIAEVERALSKSSALSASKGPDVPEPSISITDAHAPQSVGDGG